MSNIPTYGKDYPYVGSEDTFTINVANYLRYCQYTFAHIANERKTSIQRGAKFKKMGVLAGFPDMQILGKGDKRINAYFELKTKKGRLNDNQKRVLEKFQALGYKVGVVYSMDGLKEFLKECE